MSAVDLVESARVQLQGNLDSAKSQAERNRMGQFATPSPLALQILRFAKTLIPARHKVRFLDPAFGTGAFYSALLKVFPASQIESAVGFEIDPHYGKRAAELWGATPLGLRIADFTLAKAPKDDDLKPNLVICNPPYVRHHHLAHAAKLRLQNDTQQATGVRLSGLTGLYCHFLCLCHKWLAPDGVAGWLVPSEFMDVNYGQQVKRYLLEKVTLLRIHRFDPAEVQFDDALVSSAVVWLRLGAPPPGHSVEFSFGGTLAKPKVIRDIPAATLRHSAKWTRFPLAEDRVRTGRGQVVLGDLFTIKRGIATGANNLFMLTPEQVAEHGIPGVLLKPILPSPRHLSIDVVEADAKGNPILDRPLFLLACNLPEDELRTRYPSVWQYLQRGAEAGIRDGYLCRNRTPWYTQEDRPPAPFLCTYMGRQGKRGRNPFRFILNRSQATAANVYLLLYPRPALQRALRANPEMLEVVWRTLNSISAEELIGEGRIYGGGLHKVEPKELANASAVGILKALKGNLDLPPEQAELFET